MAAESIRNQLNERLYFKNNETHSTDRTCNSNHVNYNIHCIPDVPDVYTSKKYLNLIYNQFSRHYFIYNTDIYFSTYTYIFHNIYSGTYTSNIRLFLGYNIWQNIYKYGYCKFLHSKFIYKIKRLS